MKTPSLLAAAALAASASTAVSAAEVSSLSMGKFASQKVCSTYTNYWGDWLVVECHNNFAALRDRVRSALSESGAFDVSMGKTRYSVTGTVTEVGVSSSTGGGQTYGVGASKAFAGLDIRVTDTRTGRLVWGGTVTKSVDAGSVMVAGSTVATTASGPQAIYTNLQRELALAAARGVAFHIQPLQVASVDGDSISLNYGSPLLTLGDLVEAPGAGGRPVRYRVTSSSGDSAWAKAETAGTQPQIGAVAHYIDADSPTANARRIERVELP